MANLRDNDDVNFIVERLINQNGVGEGTTLPRKLRGQFRVPFASGFRILTSTASFGGTVFTLAWDTPDDKFISHYKIYARNILHTNSEPTLVGTSATSPCVARVTADIAQSVVFFIQTVLLNGQSSPVVSGPTCTGTVSDPTVTAGNIPDHSLGLVKFATQTRGTIITFDASNNAIVVGPGTSGQVLTSNGPSSQPSFQTTAATDEVLGKANLTTVGAVPYVSASGTVNQDATQFFWDSTNNRLGVGNAAPTVTLDITGIVAVSSTSSFGGNMALTGNLTLTTAGNGLLIKEGSNATMGVATLVAGTVTVNTTKVTANSRIFLTHQNNAGTVGFVMVTARTAGTSFTITSGNLLDTSNIGWLLVEPA